MNELEELLVNTLVQSRLYDGDTRGTLKVVCTKKRNESQQCAEYVQKKSEEVQTNLF